MAKILPSRRQLIQYFQHLLPGTFSSHTIYNNGMKKAYEHRMNYSPGGRGQISGAPGTSLGSSGLLISTIRNPHLRMPAQTKPTR